MAGRAGFIAWAPEQAWPRGTSGRVFFVDWEEGVGQPEGVAAGTGPGPGQEVRGPCRRNPFSKKSSWSWEGERFLPVL